MVTAVMEELEARGSRLTDLSCLEERASLAEPGRSPREPREARWELRGEASQGRSDLALLTGGLRRDGRLWWRNQGRPEDSGGIPSRSDSRGMSQLSILLLRRRYAVNNSHFINFVLTNIKYIGVRCEV